MIYAFITLGLVVAGYSLFIYKNHKKNIEYIKELQDRLAVNIVGFNDMLSEEKRKHLESVIELTTKIDYLKKEIKRHLTDIREHEILLQAVHDTNVELAKSIMDAEDVEVAKKEVKKTKVTKKK